MSIKSEFGCINETQPTFPPTDLPKIAEVELPKIAEDSFESLEDESLDADDGEDDETLRFERQRY